jgi:hypothetical protein
MEATVTERDKNDPRTGPKQPLDERDERSARKRYARPVLVEYGPIGKLTRAGSATVGDAGSMMMSCL